jgi:hypothetical protein
MNKIRHFLLAAMLLLISTSLFAQTGNVAGTVTLDDGSAAVAANVLLMGRYGGPMHPDTVLFTTITDETGAFAFNDIPAEHYIIEATLPLYYAESEMIEVEEGQTTNVTLVLEAIEFGAVSGTVSLADSLGNTFPAVGAFVSLNGHGHPGDMPMVLDAISDEAGAFTFDTVSVGTYTIMAMLPMQGHDAEVIEVLDGLTTHVNLVLEGMNHDTTGGHHGERPAELDTISLTGTVIVEVEENPAHTRTFYFLDVNADGAADYRLNFGPEWYNPENGNVRPVDGDEITVVGGLLGYAEPPLVIVWELNGLFWREPGQGHHGGHGGGWHHDHDCDVEPVGIELAGIAQVVERPDAPNGSPVMFLIDTDDDMIPNYKLDFGAPDYEPGSGAVRPEDGDDITIVGGLIDCPNSPLDFVIVYEINGLFWRTPGDTTGLGAIMGTDASEETPVTIATEYLVATNYPNPFNPTTTIEFTVPSAGQVGLAVYDITGREVATLINSNMTAGTHSVEWNGTTAPSGIYFYRLTYGDQQLTRRMLLLK